ncbi:1,4-alpha-glucan branching protein GlgB [Serinicoccus marinus]|uniref:1,4-alpha-glucan branching protein GlgB n=1 Tax=Serinicoccus marinus TaxID=247333 RepID=UPI0024924440|nr:1,4-alpha-glucan branching protein GlgB [Serinicoccus marinus]
MATLTPTFEDFLPAWVARQRWYRGKRAGAPALRRVSSIRWQDPFGEVGIDDHLLVDESGPEPVVYQVPLTYRAEAVPFLEHALVATAEHSELGTRYIYDATHDPVFADVLLREMYAEHEVPAARARRLAPEGPVPALASSRVLTGEQSNTSIIVDMHGEDLPVIIKLFRVLAEGDNPDVSVQTAVSRGGSRQVPDPVGSIEGRWVAPGGGEAHGHLAFAQEFLPGTEDAWRRALVAAGADRDFTESARSLGAATAAVHAVLRDAFGTRPAADRRSTLVAQMRTRAEQAFRDAPELSAYREPVLGVYAELESSDLPDLQRIHGDYHLGQVLDAPDRGWVLLDFEGEPLRPLAERTEPDLALRDVAGMLRSFDYAAASAAASGAGDRGAWATAARESFLDGYATGSGEDRREELTALLAALELDKALYEVSYEAQNRPDWVAIPVAAVRRLLGEPAADGRHRGAPTVPASPAAAAAAAAPTTDATAGAAAAGTATVPADGATKETPVSTNDTPPAPTSGVTDEATSGPDTPSARPESDAQDVRSEQDGTGDDYGASLIEVERHDGPLSHPPTGDRRAASGSAPASASGRGASGGYPHAPIPPPEDMVIETVPPGRRTGEDVELAPRPPAAASGWSGQPQGDPEVLRATAWEDASEGVVTARPTGPRRSLSEPAEPAGPHTLPLDLDEATDVVEGLHRNPHALLGAHVFDDHVTVRTLQPEAQLVEIVLADGVRVPMTHETGGIWVAVLPTATVPAYRLKVDTGRGAHLVDEAYRHGPSLGQTDLHLIGEGRHEELWRALGSRVMTVRDELGEVTGTRFAVWAPHASAVHVVGDFNGWNGATHALRAHDEVGVWELFVPGVREGAHYKYDITGPDGVRRAKADPMARASEVPPFTNSVVTVSTHRWGDAEWMAARAAGDIHHGPMSVYEVHLGSWRKGLGYTEIADQLVPYVARMGFTHVELMPVMHHPYGGSWGYHVTGYYAADSRFGHEDGLRYLIDRLHQAGVGVILDWVPGHFATDPWALARFDGTPIYEHPDPRKGWHPEWGSYIFDFGRPEVRNFLVANATYWLEEFHADGLRVDGVASMLYLDYSREDGQWIPNRHGGRENLEAVALLQEANATAYRRSPGVVMIAEESTSWPGVTAPTDEGGLGFGFKWNMGWMHDTLGYLGASPFSRAHSHHTLTFSLVYAFSEKYILPISHDEVVHGKGSLVRKMSGDAWQKFATTRAFLAYQWSHPGKQLLFMGSEFAQAREWADDGSLDWELVERPEHAGVQSLVADLNRLYAELPALWQIDHHEHGFSWLDANDAGRNQYSYLRWGNEGPDGLRPVVACVVNFSGVPHHQVHIGLPYSGRWREVLNTDAQTYGGSGEGNLGAVEAVDEPHQGQPFSTLVTVPPLGAVWLVPDTLTEEEQAERDEQQRVAAAAGDEADALDEAEATGSDGRPATATDAADPVDEDRVDEDGVDTDGLDDGSSHADGASRTDDDAGTGELGDGSTEELAHDELPADHPFVTEGGQPIDHEERTTVATLDDGEGDTGADRTDFSRFGVRRREDGAPAPGADTGND